MAGIFWDGQTYETTELRRFASYFATKMSYQTVSELTKERCGGVCMSDQHIQELVIEIANKVGQKQEDIIQNASSLKSPILGIADLYSPDSKEIAWFEDGVSVSQQKQKRDKIAKQGRERTTTDMILLERPLGGFEHIIASEKVDLTSLAWAKLKAYYGGKSINIVVISDGSRTIKNRCKTLFEGKYQHLLDWYHLQKKVKDLMTMIAVNKVLKSDRRRG